jgi:ComF family protein
VCACCDTPLDTTVQGCVCSRCWNAIPLPSLPICEVCGDTLPSRRAAGDGRCTRCRRRPRVITRGRSIASYEGTLRDVLHSLKYDGRRSIAKAIGERMARSGAEVLDGADALVPVPLHWIRQYRRGFNQAEELARGVGLPLVDALRRSRRTVTQTDLPEAQRLANVSGAFRLRRNVRITGQVLVLVDDVSTTGATLDACARVLLAGGAAEVRALTAARAASRLPEAARGRSPAEPPEVVSCPRADHVTTSC